MTKSIESKNSRININFKQDIINGVNGGYKM